jgi:hypothetical protein
MLEAASLPDEPRATALQCLGQLPRLYQALCETCESRYADEIARLVQAVRTLVAGVPGLAEALTARLRAMQERLGIPGPAFRLPAAAKRPPLRKAG